MLDSSDEKKKLEAMKRIIGVSSNLKLLLLLLALQTETTFQVHSLTLACFQMVAKGKDASPLFPAVVKNVACKNLEVKKLVYVYLTRYAEEQQDLALLSIATFQRAMKVCTTQILPGILIEF